MDFITQHDNMQGLTLQQLQQMGGTPVNLMPVQPTAQGLTLSQIQQMGGQPATTPAQPNLGDKVASDITQAGSQINDIMTQPGQGSAVTRGLKASGVAAGAIASPVIEAVKAIPGADLVSKLFDTLSANAAKVTTPGSQFNGTKNDMVTKIGEILNQHPEVAQKIQNTLGAVSGLGNVAGTVLAAGQGVEAGTNAANAAKIPSTPKAQFTPEEMKVQLQGVADDWAKPTTINEPKYNNARAVLEKAPEAPTTLAKNGLNPFAHIEDGKFATKDSEIQLRTDTGKLSRDILRPSLQMADYSTPVTPVADLTPKVNDFGVTPDVSEKLSKILDSKMQALERKYPNGMSLTDMLDEKITYDKNGGYSQFKSNADTNDAIANRSIANNLKTQIVDKYPLSKDFFAEQAKNYKAADYLKSLNGVKAPVDIAQSIARNVAKFGGAKLGAMFGGDIVSSFAGYQIGKVFERFIENMTNPMRDSFLQNLKITNPEAFTKVEQFMGKTEAARLTTPKLPAPSAIITPAPSENIQMEGRAKTILQK